MRVVGNYLAWLIYGMAPMTLAGCFLVACLRDITARISNHARKEN